MIDKQRAYTYFNNHFGISKSTNGWHKFDCPHCDKGRGKAKAAIKFEWERIKCWECGFTSWIVEFIEWAEQLNMIQVYELISTYEPTELELDFIDLGNSVTSQVELPPGFKIITSDGAMGVRARTYLSNRGFDIDELESKGFGYCTEHGEDMKESYFGYIIVPFTSKGRLIYFQGRDFIGNAFRFKNPPTERFGIGKGDCVFNEDALFMEDINFLTEGWADALTLGDMGISTQGWHFSARQKTLMLNSNASHQVFIPDIGFATDGVSFYKKALQAALDFVEHKNTYVLDISTISSGKDKDVNDIGKFPVLELFEKSKPLTYSDIILKLI